MNSLPHGTVTFLFTDIEGSTALWQDHRDAMTVAYERHDAILREAIAAHGGVVYKVIGDAIQAAFPTAPAAVTAALTAQRALQAESWDLPSPLRVRMALHTGAVDPDPDGDYRSPALNRLGRLLGAGHGGQILLSQVTSELSRDVLPAGVTLRDLGEQRLKDLFRPEHVSQLAGPGLLADFPVLRTLDRHPNNLPTQPTPFIGREAEVTAIRTLLARDEVRLVTLTGPGGMGKTRLSLQVAADVLDQYADGVWQVELAPLTDPALVASTIASVLGVQEAGGRPLEEVLISFIRDQQLLLVLDNFEQVTDAAAMVGTLLSGCLRLDILVTSRIRLQLRGEYEYPVPALSLPAAGGRVTLASLSQYEAVRLFIERAQAVRPDFAVTNDNAPAIAQICIRLDGLPLAIELAAARIRMLPPAAMLKRLTSRLPMLIGGARDLPVRQQTLRGAIAWSYELLTPEEQQLFRRLAVFAGGATFEAIEAVAVDDLDLEVFDGLERLVDHSLVRQMESDGEPRFTMLETIREFGFEQLDQSGELDQMQQRHAAYVLTLVEHDKPEMFGSDLKEWLDRLQPEHDNLRAACDWLLTHDVPTAYRLMGFAGKFWISRGNLREGESWLAKTLALPSPDVADVDRAQVLRWAGGYAHYRNDLAAVKSLGEESLALFRVLGIQESIAFVLGMLAVNADIQGDADRSLTMFEEALNVARRLGDPHILSRTLNELGYTVYLHGDLALARTYLSEAVTLARGEEEADYLATILHSYAEVLRADGELNLAETLLRESLDIAWRWSSPYLIADAIQGLAITAVLLEQSPRAARLFGVEAALNKAIDVHHDPGIVADLEHHIALARVALGDTAYEKAYAAGAALSLDEAVREASGIGDNR